MRATANWVRLLAFLSIKLRARKFSKTWVNSRNKRNKMMSQRRQRRPRLKEKRLLR